ncbi:T-cell surface glycoprotein CD8 beta chain-like [Xiphophorus couchianus]|uniref:T-cell surface glycoprotein CD8 beta chain-like n=1 Tax=Xiphophorus couchianus TaxID=32473 RepID=UPI001016E2B7|nr:T-cell surface glycoprotein CD8 beta chain-like [Xiphophorus couchianus]
MYAVFFILLMLQVECKYETESEPDITAVTQDSLSDAVHEGDSVSLHCSVLSHLEKKTCPEERKVFWFQVSSPQSHPSLIYAQNEGDGKCEENPESQSGQRCVFNFVKDNISSSDTGTYYCALAACGMVVFGNGTKLEFKDVSMNNSQRNNTLLLLLCGILVLMLIATALLVYLIRKKCWHFSKGTEFPGKNAVVVCGQLQNQQRNEESLVYSTAVFTQRNDDRVGRVKARRKEGTIYSDVRIFDEE